MHNQSQIPGTTALHGSTFGADYELMPCPPPDRGRRLSCPTGPNLPSNYNMSVSGPDLTTSHHYTPVGRSVAPAMSPSWDMCGFPSSYAATRDEAAGATASSLGSAASVGGLRYAQIREHVNDGDSSELGSEHGNGRRSQDTEDRYYLHSDDEQGEDGGRTANGPLNCPYRKRNKERFNIRDHVKCTNPFKEFAHLKSHIKTCHKRQRPLIQHEGQVEGDVEDGITEDIDNLLVARKNRHKVSNWEVLWKTLFPLDTKVPSPVYEPCIKAAADEFPAIAKKAINADGHGQVYLVFDILTQNVNGGWLNAELLSVASQIVTTMNQRLEERCCQSVREFEHAALQKYLARSRSLQPRPTKPHRRGNGGSRDMVGKGSPILPDQLAPRQNLPHLVPNPVRDNTSPLNTYSLHAVPHQQCADLNTTNSLFPATTDSGYHQGWAPQTTEGGFAMPTGIQFGPRLESMVPAISAWDMEGLPGHHISGNVQDNQSSAGGIPEAYSHSPAAYGSHLNQ